MGGKKWKYLSLKDRWEFNCKENQLRPLAVVFFSDNMSRGTRLYKSEDFSSASDIKTIKALNIGRTYDSDNGNVLYCSVANLWHFI